MMFSAKKLMSWLLALMLLVQMVPGVAFAAEASGPIEISIGSVDGSAGDSVTVAVSISNNTGFAGFSFLASYDSAALTLTDITQGDVLNAVDKSGLSINVEKNVMTWATTGNTTGDGTLLNLTFTINENAAAGTYPLTLEVEDFFYVDDNARYLDCDANFTAGSVTVSAGSQTLPVITTQPSDQTFYEGQKVSFSVEAEGEGLTYQWYLKYANGSWSAWSGRTTATTAAFACTTKHDGLKVYCVITDANGNSVTSDIATLTVKANPFTDIGTDSVYYTAVMWAYETGITSGTTATTFSPNAVCTRAQVVVFLWRYMGEPEPEDQENPFTDVDPSSSSYKAIMWAYQNGITTGINATTFGPSNKVSRAQFVLFLWRAMGKPEPETTVNPFVDVSDTSSYYKAVLWTYENGITTGVDATHFDPDTSCTRAQVVAFLYRGLAE